MTHGVVDSLHGTEDDNYDQFSAHSRPYFCGIRIRCGGLLRFKCWVA